MQLHRRPSASWWVVVQVVSNLPGKPRGRNAPESSIDGSFPSIPR